MRDAGRAARPLPPARVRGATRLVGWMIALAMLPPGWLFILHSNRWHVTPPVIVLGLAWLAVVAGGVTLVRAANATVEPVTDEWFVAAGSRDDLEREKKSLVRAIKEIEFDRDTGKLSERDANVLLATYRARAIEVLKALELGDAQSPRERILAEIKARAQLDRRPAKARGGKGKVDPAVADAAANAAPASGSSAPAPSSPSETASPSLVPSPPSEAASSPPAPAEAARSFTAPPGVGEVVTEKSEVAS